jgi:hypothetical protein
MPSLFLTISRLENSIERKILEWELDIGPDFYTSFIARIKKILNKYMSYQQQKKSWKKHQPSINGKNN